MIKIQPVSKGYFSSMKVTLREIAAKRRAGTVLFTERQNPDGTKTQAFLMPEGAAKVRVGSTVEAQHIRTKRPYGPHKILSSFDLKFKNGVLHIGDAKPGTLVYSEAFDLEAVAFEMV